MFFTNLTKTEKVKFKLYLFYQVNNKNEKFIILFNFSFLKLIKKVHV